MRPQALLDAASELVRRLLRFDEAADRAVDAYFRAHRSLGARDRRVVADTVYTVLRRLSLFRHLAGAQGPAQARRLAILGWQGDEATLQSAITDDERRWIAEARAVDCASLPEPLRHNLPAWIAEPLRALLGEELAAWAASVDAPAPLDLRVNLVKSTRKEALAALAAQGVDAVPTRYSPIGIRVAGKPSLRESALVEQGAVAVQDEGSQLLALLVGARRGEIVVDFCAGSGGKTLALGAQMRNSGRVFAIDVSGHRLAELAPRLARSGLDNVHPMQIANERDERLDRLAGKADRVLVDAPCSGVGTLRRHPDLKWRHDERAITGFAARQREILAAAARLVKPGGRLVYATCSPLGAEDEDVARAFDAANAGLFFRVSAAAALEKAGVGDAESLGAGGDDLRLWTHRHGTDSFFAALWQRR